jgi:antitoxin CcdA
MLCASAVGSLPVSGARRATKAVNVSIPADLLEAARACDINLSATLTASLEQRLREHRREEWLAENAQGIEAYNRDVEEHGSFGDTLHSF